MWNSKLEHAKCAWKGQNRKTKVLLKIVRRLLKTRLEEKSNRQTEKIRKDGNRRTGNCEWTVVEAGLQDWNRKITSKNGTSKEKEENILEIVRRLLETILEASVKKKAERIREDRNS